MGAMVVDRALREEGEEGAFARSEGSRSAGTSTEGQSTE